MHYAVTPEKYTRTYISSLKWNKHRGCNKPSLFSPKPKYRIQKKKYRMTTVMVLHNIENCEQGTQKFLP